MDLCNHAQIEQYIIQYVRGFMSKKEIPAKKMNT